MFLWRRVAPQSPEDGLKPTAAPGYARNFRDLNRQISQGKSFSGYERNILFLNLNGGRFADVGGLLGVDYDDDARAVASVDWDRDGDLDLWVTNRTAPRVRLLNNNHPSGNGYLAVRLIGNGKSTNRDAIGARLTLSSSSDPALNQIRTVHAGDGFLSQSSAWSHFGLGATPGSLVLRVAWPGGDTETFPNVQPNAHYIIRQGQEKLDGPVLATRSAGPSTVPVVPVVPETPGASGFWVANRVPFPNLSYADTTGSPHSTTDFRGRPVLVTLWATWCAPCLKELASFASQEKKLSGLGATVLALNVDGLAVSGGAESDAKPEAVLSRLGFTLPQGIANQEALAKIEVLIEFLSSRRESLSIPSSFLIDSEGNVAAVYLEAVGFEQVASDMALLNATSAHQLTRLSPRAGRWFSDPRQIDRAAYLGDYATLFVTNGFADEAQRLYQMIKPQDGTRSARDFYNQAKAAQQQGAAEQAVQHYQAALNLDPEYGEALTGLGSVLLLQKRVDEARGYFERALAIDPNHAAALVNLAMIDQRQGKTESALERLRKVIARNPDYAEAHLTLGSMLASLKNHTEAIASLTKAIELNPKLTAAHLNLATAFMETGQWKEAEIRYREALTLNPRSGFAHAALGNLLARQQKHAEAAAEYQIAITMGLSNPQTYTQLGHSLLALGQKQSATSAFQSALKLDPNHAGAKRAMQDNGLNAE